VEPHFYTGGINQPRRVINFQDSTPMKLYVYDHCPFCVKARSIFGLKGVAFDLVILLNDDEATPTRMIGKKMAPILEDAGTYLAESMDIVARIDDLAGAPVLTGPHNEALAQWNNDVSGALFSLALPRWAASDFEEFSTPEARAYFTRNKERMIGSFEEKMAASPGYIAEVNRHLLALEPLIQSPNAVNGELSEDDIHLFATLRSMSIVRGIVYPPAVEAYRLRMAQRTGIDLHDHVAI
jgi:glutaredoxin 2